MDRSRNQKQASESAPQVTAANDEAQGTASPASGDERCLWRVQLFGALGAQLIPAPAQKQLGFEIPANLPPGARQISKFTRQKTAALLAFLALKPTESFTREFLSELLWQDVDPEQGRNNLRVALTALRTHLEPEGVPKGTVLQANRTFVGLNAAAITTDVADFQASLVTARNADSDSARREALAAAVDFYMGRLLPGFYDDWASAADHRTTEAFYQALAQLMAQLQAEGSFEAAIDYAQRGIAIDPSREEAHREAMRLYAAAGQPANVLRQYSDLERILQENNGEVPSDATRELVQNIEERHSRRPSTGKRKPLQSPEELSASGIVTLLLTDIQGSTRRHSTIGDGVRDEINKHNRIVRNLIHRWGGHEIKSKGDSFMVSFERASAAIQCAIEIQQSLARQTWHAEAGELLLRIGIHTGEPFQGYGAVGESDFFGPLLHRTERIADAGHGGQILISAATHDIVQGILPPAVQLSDLGHHQLRGLVETQQLYEVSYARTNAAGEEIGARQFPPLRTLDTIRTNLPTRAGTYIGRDRELAELEALLGQPATRLITLTGFGGIGKTRTALHLAELSAFKFADGIWWVELEEARTTTALIQRIAYHVGLKLGAQASVREQLHGHLKHKQALLVLDNVEQIPNAAGEISDLLAAAPHLKCLVTSRHALELRRELRRELAPLPTSEAVLLFCERAAAHSNFILSDENAADVQQLCRSLEGVPLAIELAASRIAGLTPREIRERLDDRFRLLQSTTPDLPPRQRVLRNTIDWSFDLLTPERRELFSRLSVFAGGFTLDDAEALGGNFDVFEGVMALQRWSLLRAETDERTQQTRFSMLDLLRDYAAEKLRSEPETERRLRAEHATYFLEYGRQRVLLLRTPEEASALDQLAVAYDNLRAATEWSIGAGQHALGADLALQLGTFLERRGFQKEATTRIRQGLDAARDGNAIGLSAQLLQARARLYLDQFEWPEAQHCAGRALLLFEAAGDERAIATTTNLLGLAAKGEGVDARERNEGELTTTKFAQARGHYEKALYHFERLGDTTGISLVRHNLGLIEYLHGEPENLVSAREHWQEALRLHREIGDLRGSAETLVNLGVMAQGQGTLDAARQFYTEALAIEHQLQHAVGVGRALANLGEIAQLQDDLPRARRLFAAAECLFERSGSPYLAPTSKSLREISARLENDATCAARDYSPMPSLQILSLSELVVWATG